MIPYSLQEAPSPLIIAQLCLSAGTSHGPRCRVPGAWCSHVEAQVRYTVMQRCSLQGVATIFRRGHGMVGLTVLSYLVGGGNPKASDRLEAVSVLLWFSGLLKEFSPALTWDPILYVVG